MRLSWVADGEAYDFAALLQGDPCSYCGGPVQKFDRDRITGIDHIVPRSNGGDGTWLNLTHSCKFCNSSKGKKSLLEFLLAPKIRFAP